MFFSYCFTDFSARWRGHETGGVSRCTDYSGYWHTRFDLFRWFGWLKKEQETMHKTRNYAMRVALRWWYLHLVSPGSDAQQAWVDAVEIRAVFIEDHVAKKIVSRLSVIIEPIAHMQLNVRLWISKSPRLLRSVNTVGVNAVILISNRESIFDIFRGKFRY